MYYSNAGASRSVNTFCYALWLRQRVVRPAKCFCAFCSLSVCTRLCNHGVGLWRPGLSPGLALIELDARYL